MNFQIKINPPAATSLLFKVDPSNPLDKNKVKLFHKTMDRGLLLYKVVRLGIQPTISVLFSRAKHPNQGYWNKLLTPMKYILGTQESCLKLNAEKQVV